MRATAAMFERTNAAPSRTTGATRSGQTTQEREQRPKATTLFSRQSSGEKGAASALSLPLASPPSLSRSRAATRTAQPAKPVRLRQQRAAPPATQPETQRLEYWNRLRAPAWPYFFRSFFRAS